ncbi:glycosyltransferase family 2 protein [Silanimonas sp.]|uniref:glycosyltransferase family 2 protein n=1 Tax=Silanimonas sp. TaxID=1929290 RepID=UPI001BBC67FF|nr:glycosyltransferase family 2 protein [Silanimonas sp.]MBS3895447.1 glycosyltransferase family 2 protein [Silanimonas sp.]
MKQIDILCPVFREEDALHGFHARLRAALQPLGDGYTFRFIYVMDPSPDRTEAVLRDMALADRDITVLVMSRRFGHQAALLAGIDAARGDALVMLDSDGQHPPEIIPVLVERWEAGSQIVQTLRKDGSETGWLKRSMSAWFYRILSNIGSIELKGGAADFRLLDRSVVEVIRSDFGERNIFLRGIIAWVGYATSFVEFEPLKRMNGTSNYRASILINFAIQGISSFSKFPLRLCTAIGMIIAVLSVLAAVLMVLDYFAGTQVVPGWATLLAFVAFLGGVQLFFMGVFGEYLGQVFDEVKGRPRYLVARRYVGSPESTATIDQSSTNDR